ncbi:hypothetical protein, partial [Enterococcus faecium]
RRDASPAVRARFALTARAILAFALGCAAAAVLFALAAFWALGAPVAVALAIVVLRLNGHLASEPA